MPTAYIKKMAKAGHGSVESLEKKWDEAKAKAKEQGKGDNFAIVTTIFKSIIGASTIEAKARLLATAVTKEVAQMDSVTQYAFSSISSPRRASMTNFAGSKVWVAKGKPSADDTHITLVNGEKAALSRSQAERLCKQYVETGQDYL